MASKSLFIILAIVILPNVALAKDYIVGDKAGWTLKFDYQGWAKGKQFFVGDRLIFRYPVGAHNVFKVNGTGFQACVVPPASEALTSGYDIIPLATEGRKWYICRVGKHCALGGMKLFIEVAKYYAPIEISPAYAPSPVLEEPLTPFEISPAEAPPPASGC